MKACISTLFVASVLAAPVTIVHARSPASEAADATQAFRPAPCETGIFRKDNMVFVAMTRAGKGFDYTFSDGTTGNTQDADALVECGQGAVRVGANETWPKVAIAESNTRFASHGVLLAGRLLEAPGAGKHTPLVVYAHGSEESASIDHARDPYQMVGRGISVFVYDKRGTGLSGGDYTQNFPRLADDLVAAAREARRLADGRHGRFGLVGLSQGGWIAPLAAARARAQFIGIGYGLAVDIAEQDAAQVAMELRERGDVEEIVARGRMATDITARLVRSAHKDGLDELAAFQERFGKEPWFQAIRGGYTGVYLGIPADHLRKHGLPQFEKLEVDWSHDPVQVLKKVDVPMLWALAENDRQAPIALTVERLSALRKQGRDIAIHVFPATGHGMWHDGQAAGLSRRHRRIAPGFYDLMADWAKGQPGGPYGTAYRQ